MDCGSKAKGQKSESSLDRNKRAIESLVARNKLQAAAFHRHLVCASASECGFFCVNIEKDAGEIPRCVDAETYEVYSTDLHRDWRRPDFACPRERF